MTRSHHQRLHIKLWDLSLVISDVVLAVMLEILIVSLLCRHGTCWVNCQSSWAVTPWEEGGKMAQPTTSTDWLTDCHLVPEHYVKLVHYRLSEDAKQAHLIPKLCRWTELWRWLHMLYIHRWIHYRAVTVMRQLRGKLSLSDRIQVAD